MDSLDNNDSPKIVFPCSYPIKVMGHHVDDYVAVVLAIIRTHAPDLREEDVSLRPSREGRYISVNVRIFATGESQLQALFNDLKACGRVKLVL